MANDNKVNNNDQDWVNNDKEVNNTDNDNMADTNQNKNEWGQYNGGLISLSSNFFSLTPLTACQEQQEKSIIMERMRP